MNREDVLAYLGGCFFGEPASCVYACPFRLDVRAFLKKMEKGRFDAAYKELCLRVPFPALVAARCDGRCAGACQCATVLDGEAVRIRALEQACLRLVKRAQPPVFPVPQKETRIAVVGAGAAGLSCALTLARKKYQVTVFERESGWGGSLRSDPDFPVFDADFALQFSKEQCDFRFGEAVESLDALTGFDAVLIATGTPEADFGLRAHWDSVLGSSARPGVFLCGGVCGQELMDGMAAGVRCARSIEAYIQTQNAENARDDWDTKKACRYVSHEGVEPSAAVDYDSEGGYLAAGAKAEAARCMQCECRSCMNVCELMEHYKKAPTRVASDVLQDGEARNSVSSAAITRETWSCNLCGRCADKCSEGTDVGGMLQLSRVRRVEGNLYPPAIHAYWLDEMRFASGEAALALPGSGGYAFFPGCRLGAALPETTRRCYALLRERYGAGLLLGCCGIPAYWAGEEAALREHIRALRERWEGLGSPTLILACPSCARFFGKYLPEIPLVSLYTLLPPEEAKGLPEKPECAVFDPCAARNAEEKQAVRALVKASGTALADFDSDGKCCGFGGHMQLANPALYRRITENRVSETDMPYVAWCSNCRDTFLSRGKEAYHLLELYFGVREPYADLEKKRENLLGLKRALLADTGGAAEPESPAPWDGVAVVLTPELEQKMEETLIPLRYVRRAIWEAERGGTGFSGPDGLLLCCLVLDTVTVWVRARRRDPGGAWQLENVYSHRMRVSAGG